MSAFIHNKSFKKGKKKDKRSTTVLIDSAKGRLSERTYFKLLVPSYLPKVFVLFIAVKTRGFLCTRCSKKRKKNSTK